MAEETAKTGPDPDPKDKTTVVDPSTTVKKDDVADPSPKEEPWHKDPRFKNDLGLLKTAKSLMESNKLDSVEELKELIESGKKVKGKPVDLDNLDEIVAKAAKLDKYEAYWKDQKEKQQREGETPEDTIKRLEGEKKQLESEHRRKSEADKQAADAKKALKAYESEVETLVSEVEAVSKEHRPFVLEFFGVGNPANEIDITDRKAVKKMVADGVKKLESFKQAVIADYLKGKEKIPKIGSTTTTVTDPNAPKINLKGARAALMEALKSKGG